MARKFQRKRRAQPAALIMVLIAALAVALLLGRRVFVVRRLQVRGNSAYSSQSIAERSGITLGQSIFSIREDKVREAFASNGHIALEGVSVRWPDMVEITVKERKGYAYVSYLGTAFLVSDDCVVMEKLSALPTGKLPIVTGMNVAGCNVGDVIHTSVTGQAETAMAVVRSLVDGGAQNLVSELNVSDLDNLYLIARSGMLVQLGDKDKMDEKIMWMKNVLAQLNAEGTVKGTIDVSSANSAIYSP